MGKGFPSALYAGGFVIVSQKWMLLLLFLPCKSDFVPYSRRLGKSRAVYFPQGKEVLQLPQEGQCGAWVTFSCTGTGCRRKDLGRCSCAPFCEQGRMSFHSTELDLGSRLLHRTLSLAHLFGCMGHLQPSPILWVSQRLCQCETTQGGWCVVCHAREQAPSR